MHSIYVTYIKVSKGAKIRNRYNQVPHLTQVTNGEVTNSQTLLYQLQILDSIWVITAQILCMLQPTIQHLVKKVFVIVDEPKYKRNTSMYCDTMFVQFVQQLTGYTKIFWLFLISN